MKRTITLILLLSVLCQQFGPFAMQKTIQSRNSRIWEPASEPVMKRQRFMLTDKSGMRTLQFDSAINKYLELLGFSVNDNNDKNVLGLQDDTNWRKKSDFTFNAKRLDSLSQTDKNVLFKNDLLFPFAGNGTPKTHDAPSLQKQTQSRNRIHTLGSINKPTEQQREKLLTTNHFLDSFITFNSKHPALIAEREKKDLSVPEEHDVSMTFGDRLCRLVCSQCNRLLGLRWTSLCWIDCAKGGRAFNACLQVLTISLRQSESAV